MTVNLSLLGGAGWQFSDNNGVPLSGGLLYTYAAGTTTPQTTYTSASGVTANTNPVVLDAGGRVVSEIWLTQGQDYKFVLKTSAGVTLGTYDNVPGVNDPSNIYAALAAPTGSSLVGFIQSGTGAIATTVQAKLRQYVSVQDFGAVANGIVNDSAAVQAAINASPSGSVIDFATGSYLLSTEIAINKPLTIFLNGSTITSSAANIFTITSSGVLIDGDFAQITHTGTGVAIRTNPASAINYTNFEVIRTSITGSGSGAGGILFRNVHYGRVDAFLTGYSAGYGLTIEGHPTGHANDYAMRCVVEGTTRIENHLYGIVLGGVNGPANANEIHARVTACTVGITWLIGRPNYISNANIEFCTTGINGSTHSPVGVLTVIGCNFENNTTDVTNANNANTRIAVYQSDIFSVSDPGQMMIISNAGAASGVNTSLRIQQWGEGFRYTAPPFSAIPTSTFGGDIYVNTLSGSGGSLFVKSGLGYSTGAGSSVTQTTSRTTDVNAGTPCGSITLVSAAGTTAWQSFSVLTPFASATDTVIVNQKSGTDKYMIHVTSVTAGAFQITFATTSGTTTESPVFNFSIIQSVAS